MRPCVRVVSMRRQRPLSPIRRRAQLLLTHYGRGSPIVWDEPQMRVSLVQNSLLWHVVGPRLEIDPMMLAWASQPRVILVDNCRCPPPVSPANGECRRSRRAIWLSKCPPATSLSTCAGPIATLRALKMTPAGCPQGHSPPRPRHPSKFTRPLLPPSLCSRFSSRSPLARRPLA